VLLTQPKASLSRQLACRPRRPRMSATRARLSHENTHASTRSRQHFTPGGCAVALAVGSHGGRADGDVVQVSGRVFEAVRIGTTRARTVTARRAPVRRARPARALKVRGGDGRALTARAQRCHARCPPRPTEQPRVHGAGGLNTPRGDVHLLKGCRPSSAAEDGCRVRASCKTPHTQKAVLNLKGWD
jgi:hypothetical protein